MVTILNKVPGFGEQLGAAIGGGFGGGFAKSMEKAQEASQQMAINKAKALQGLELYNEIKSKRAGTNLNLSDEQKKQKFIEMLPEFEKMNGEELTPENLDNIWQNFDQVLQATGQGSQQGQMQEEDPFEEAEILAALGQHDLSRVSMEKAKSKRKEESEKKSRHYEVAKESFKHASELARTLPQKEAALESMKDAIKSNNLSYFSPDNIAELTGIDAFRSPEGAAFKTASKEFFLGNTLRVGAKGLNQWFEKQVLEMGPKIGRSVPANLAVTEMLDMEMDIQKKEIELTNSIADEMEAKPGGFIKRDLAQKVQSELSKYAIERQKEAKKTIEEIKDRYEPVNKSGHLMRDPSGSLRRVSPKDYKAAKQAGYTVAQ